MRTAIVWLVLVSSATSVVGQQYSGGYGRNGSYSAVVQSRRIAPRQFTSGYGNYQPRMIYRTPRRLYQPLLHGYGYGNDGIYTSADQPIIINNFYSDSGFYSGW